MEPKHIDGGLLIDQTPHVCPYLPGEVAVLPARWYSERIDPARFDALLAKADRRVGRSLYRPTCPDCDACQAIRVPVKSFRPSRSQRRAEKRNSDVVLRVAPPAVDAQRLALFNAHKLERGLASHPTPAEHYLHWLVLSCVETLEFSYWCGDRLLAVSVVDLGVTSMSSVYHYFDPRESRRSLGVYSVLAEIDWMRKNGLDFYYLGLFIEACRAMNYKSRFLPNERLESGVWVHHA